MMGKEKSAPMTRGEAIAFWLKLAGYLLGLFVVGIAMFWARRHMHH
jgi:hypothetical protein